MGCAMADISLAAVTGTSVTGLFHLGRAVRVTVWQPPRAVLRSLRERIERGATVGDPAEGKLTERGMHDG
jgi:hypothetical protein